MKVKKYHPIKYEKNDDFRFIVSTGSQVCSHCKKEIKYEEIILTYQYYMRFHFGCINEFERQLKDFQKKYTKEMCIEMLKK